MSEGNRFNPAASLRSLPGDLSSTHIVNAIVAFLFAVSGPVAIMLSVGTSGGMSAAEMASWIAGAFALNGIISIWYCLRYRQPLIFLWTISGIVLVGAALNNLPFAEVVGAYYMTGVLIAILGVTGWFRLISGLLPMPIVMGMVAGVLLTFGITWIRAIHDGFWIAAPMTVAYFGATAWPALASRVPPLLVALVVGALAIVLAGEAPVAGEVVFAVVEPVVFSPVFTVRAAIELVIPLAITVVFVQNGQGIALLKSVGHEPPIDSATTVCGVGSILVAVVGAVSTCLTGPVTGIIVASGNPKGHYASGVVMALMCIAFGVMAPFFTTLILATPAAFISTLGGIALIRVLLSAFTSALGGKHSLGGLVAFLVTVSEVSFFNIGAPFWGLVLGGAAAWAVASGTDKASSDAG